jgi:hypothetical protein
MPFQPVEQVAQITCQGVVDSQITINDIYFQNSAAVTPINLGTLVADMSDWFTASLAPLLSDDWSTVRVRGVDLTTITGPVAETSNSTPGGSAGEAAPNNVAACVSFRTAQRGRSARGRNFVPGIPNSLITLNTLDNGFISDLLIAYNALVGPGTFSAGWQMVIVSRVTENSVRPTGLAIPVTSVIMVGNSVRSMRSREIGHGA